ARPGAQRSSCDNALEIVQQDDEWDPIASEPLLEEQRCRQMRLRSGTEQDDFRAAFLQQAVERFERVTGTDQQQAWVSSDELLELPPRARQLGHHEHSYHAAGACARRSHDSTVVTGTASARLPCTIALIPITLPLMSARGPPEKPGARRRSARIQRSPVVAPVLGNVDDAERGHADEPAGMADRDHELTHLQRHLPELSKHRRGRL